MKKVKRISKNKEVKKVLGESGFGAILERMEDGIKIVAEGVTGVQRQLDGLTDEVHSFRDEMYSFRDEMYFFRTETNARFEQIDARFERVEANQKITLEHLFTTDERFEAVEKELKEIKLELARLSKNILTPEETKSFSKRIASVEKGLEELRTLMRSKTRLKAA